jgi:anti-sigma-K factor RskA
MTQHSLTDEQFADLLAGRPSAETLADLNGDAGSEMELSDLKSALQSYRSETLAWAERRAAAAPSLVPVARRRARWMAVPQWSMAAIAVAAVAVGIGHFSGHGADEAVGNTPAIGMGDAPIAGASKVADSVSDDELLTSIDAALSYGTSPVDGLGLKSTGNEGAPRHNME